MKKLRLKKLTLINFKGAKKMTVNVDGRQEQNIYGPNGALKTTILDAYLWLFTGKDSHGRTDSGKGSFDLKTLDENNQVIHNLEHSVEAVFQSESQDIVLKRIFKEDWTKREEEPYLKGHKTDYRINNVPLNKREFEAQIADQVADVSVVKLLSDPKAFCNLPWNEAREILIEISGDKRTDIELMQSEGKFTSLVQMCSNKSIFGLQKEKKATALKLKKDIDEIPIRIEENLNKKPEKEDWGKFQTEKTEIEKEIQDIQNSLNDVPEALKTYNQKIAQLNDELSQVEQKLYSLKNKAQTEFSDSLHKKDSEKKKLSNAVLDIKNELQRQETSLKEKQSDLETTKEFVSQKAKELKEAQSKEFSASEIICPYNSKACTVPEIVSGEKEILEEKFNRSKVDQVNQIMEKGKTLYKKQQTLESEIQELIEEIDLKREILEGKEKEVSEFEQTYPKLKSTQAIMESYPEYTDYEKDAESIKKKIESLAKPEIEVSEEEKTNKKELIQAKKSRVGVINEILAKKTEIEKIDKRVSELKTEQKELSADLSMVKKDIYLIDSFIKFKISILDKNVNSNFDTIRFKFFRKQINGEYEEICEPLVNGVPWKAANNAAQIITGVEIIKLLQNHYQLSMPVIIDNRESIVDNLPENVDQVVNLYVYEDEENSGLEPVSNYHKYFKESEKEKGSIFLTKK